jgi:phage terminase large subunit-like protein
MESLRPELQEMAVSDPVRFQTTLRAELVERRKHYPSVDFVPNIGQERAFRCLEKRHLTYGRFPHKVFVLGGNGSGKTALCAGVLLAGACLGPDAINKEFFGNHEYFRYCAEIRSKRKLGVRLVCDAKDMKEDAGSLYQQIAKWIPTAQFSNKTGDFFQTVIIGEVKVDVKTHDMKVTSQAGPDEDLVIFNEPPPEPVYDENIARTRGEGIGFVFCTPLDAAAYLLREINQPAPDGEIVSTEVSIWDNCIDVPGNRGQLTREAIESQIRDWSKNPDTLQARVWGKFAHLAGAIFKAYKEDIHVIDPFLIDRSYNLYHICDPHLVKPPFAAWVAVNALGQAFVVAEYPNEPWDTLKSTELTIEHHCKNFDLMERGQNPEFDYLQTKSIYRIGDPNIMPTKMPNTNRTILTEYSLNGWDYDCSVEDSIELGHDKIRGLIYYDSLRTISAVNQPGMYVFRTCKNVRRALQEFGIKKTADQYAGTMERIDQTWSCPIACLRYFGLKMEPWTPWRQEGNYGMSEYDAIRAGRDGRRVMA